MITEKSAMKQEIDRLNSENSDLRLENAVYEDLVAKHRLILNSIANAISGNGNYTTTSSYHDLVKKVSEIVAERDSIRKDIAQELDDYAGGCAAVDPDNDYSAYSRAAMLVRTKQISK